MSELFIAKINLNSRYSSLSNKGINAIILSSYESSWDVTRIMKCSSKVKWRLS